MKFQLGDESLLLCRCRGEGQSIAVAAQSGQDVIAVGEHLAGLQRDEIEQQLSGVVLRCQSQCVRKLGESRRRDIEVGQCNASQRGARRAEVAVDLIHRSCRSIDGGAKIDDPRTSARGSLGSGKGLVAISSRRRSISARLTRSIASMSKPSCARIVSGETPANPSWMRAVASICSNSRWNIN